MGWCVNNVCDGTTGHGRCLLGHVCQWLALHRKVVTWASMAMLVSYVNPDPH